MFRSQYRDHEGNGDDVVYSADRSEVVAEQVIPDGSVDIGPIKQQKVLAQGKVKADRRWSGVFLVRVLEGFEERLVLQEYREGKLIKTAATDIQPPCDLPAWPK
jgi:hypothetical protein